MNTFARIEEGVVRELLSTDSDVSTMFHPSLVWVPCPQDVQEGWLYAEGKFAANSDHNGPTLEQAKAAKLAAIHAEKNRTRDGGFLVDGVLFDSDLPARTSYAELAIALQQDPSLTLRWKASPGVWVTMDAALFAKVYATGRKHLEACFAWQEAQEQALAEAKTVEMLQAQHTTVQGNGHE